MRPKKNPDMFSDEMKKNKKYFEAIFQRIWTLRAKSWTLGLGVGVNGKKSLKGIVLT